MQVISATEASRRLSRILNLVKYQGQSFEIKRGREIVARLVPAGPPSSVKASDLPRILAELPPLSKAERESFARDMRRIRALVPPPDNPWA